MKVVTMCKIPNIKIKLRIVLRVAACSMIQNHVRVEIMPRQFAELFVLVIGKP